MDSSLENCSVKVAVHLRPLIGDERVQGCKECVSVTPGKPQVVSEKLSLMWLTIRRMSFHADLS